MPGPAPKDPTQRRRRNAPARGEWVDLKPFGAKEKRVLPPLPRRKKGTGPWPERTASAWAGWREDPVTRFYTPADIVAAVELAHVHARMVALPDAKLESECRQRAGELGLTPKGKRDLRWRLPAEEEAPEGEHRGARARPKQRVRAVAH